MYTTYVVSFKPKNRDKRKQSETKEWCQHVKKEYFDKVLDAIIQ